MKCPKCQFDNPQGSKFCNQCGNKLEVACPKCGSVNPLDSKFCNECGHDFGQPAAVPTIDYSQPQTYTPKFLDYAIELKEKQPDMFHQIISDYEASTQIRGL